MNAVSANARPVNVFTMPAQYLKGVGPKKAEVLKKLGIATVADLLYHFPRRYEDRSRFAPIAQLLPDVPQTVHGQVAAQGLFRSKRGTLIFQLTVKDATGTLYALWFNQPYMRAWFKTGQEIILYGRVERIGRKVQMMVPEFELVTHDDQEPIHTGRIVPIYPSTSGLHQRAIRSMAKRVVDQYAARMPDPLPPAIRERYALLPLAAALAGIHFPESADQQHQAEVRVGFDDLLLFQLAAAQRRHRVTTTPGITHRPDGPLISALEAQLPFVLTSDQRSAIGEILTDMARPHPMHRLLHGDVGSGKTIVAAFAAACAIQSGSQAAVMAPTEILAEQHAATLRALLTPIGITVGLLTGSVPLETRSSLVSGIQQGTVHLVVGTHALVQESVAFQRLGLVIIDEQHKFGVGQRAALRAKGAHPDLLVMTATPIPRTLALTAYGDLEVTAIRHLPPGRQPITTTWAPTARRQEIYALLKQALDAGRQCYVVCPRIAPPPAGPPKAGGPLDRSFGPTAGGGVGPSEARPMGQHPAPAEAPVRPFGQQDLFELPEADLKAATKIFEHFRDRAFPGYRVGLLHGRLPDEEKDQVMRAFKDGAVQLLVSTQVIEVGIDVPNATVMLVEQADRFGLAQLHQLRGRVGRGAHESSCVLLADPMTPEARQRLETLVATQDGFEIAEADLTLRGPGEMFGKRQSGLPEIRLGALALDPQWLDRARREAFALIAQDPRLAQPAHQGLAVRLARQFKKLEENKSFITS